MKWCKWFLFLAMGLGLVPGKTLLAEEVDIVLKVKKAPVTPASMAQLFKLGATTKDPRRAQYLFRAAGAGLLSISRFDLYNQHVRANIYECQDFETKLMAVCPDCQNGDPSCHVCHGSGTCQNCNGRGGTTVRGITRMMSTQCPHCRGSGQCATCHGRGQETCPRCGGKRKALSRERAEAAYAKAIEDAVAIYSQGETVKSFASKEYTAEEALEHGISVILDAAKRKQIGSITTTGFLFNGRREQALGEYYENECSMELVNQAPPSIDIMDRSDMPDTERELALENFDQDGLSTVLMGADAFLMGEVLYDSAYSQALFAMRLIDTHTLEVLAAAVDVVRIDSSLCSRLKLNLMAVRNQPNMVLLPPGNPQMDTCIENMKSAKTVAFSSLREIPQEKQLSARIFYAQMAAKMAGSGIHLIEREFLTDILKEQALADRSVDKLLAGGWILKTTCDSTSQDKAGITFFVKALAVQGTVTKGMFKATLLSPAK